MRIKYQASFFADLSSITATPENTLSLMNALSGNGVSLLPNSFREITSPNLVPVARPSFVSPEGDSQVVIASARLDMIKQVPPVNGPEIGTVDAFLDFVEKCTDAIFRERVIHGARLAFIMQSFSDELPNQKLNDCFNEIFVAPDFYSDKPPIEWTFRANSNSDIDLCERVEKLNAILKIERIQGQFIDTASGLVEFDRIVSEIDINTITANTSARFTPTDMRKFVDTILPIARNLETSVRGRLGDVL